MPFADSPICAVTASSPPPFEGSAPRDPRWQQIADFIAKLPPEKAGELRSLLAGDGLVGAKHDGFSLVLKALEIRRASDHDPNASEPLMRRVCNLLQPFLVDRMDYDRPGAIRRQSLVPWWEASMAQSAVLRDIDQQYQRAAHEKISAEMERLEEEAMAELAKRAPSLSLKNIAQVVMEDIRRIGIVLAGGMALAKALRELRIDGPPTPPGIELAPALVRRFGKAYEALGTDRSFDPVWLGHAVMNHLAKPWEVVTLIRRVTGCTDIQALEQTELAPLIDRAMDQLVAVGAEAARAIKLAADLKQADEITVAHGSANRYFDMAEAIAQEVKLERTSGWGHTYMGSRKDLSDLIAGKLEAFEHVITTFLASWNPTEHAREDHPACRAALAAADFIGAMKLRGGRHGFAMPFSSLDRRLEEALARPMTPPPDHAPDPWPERRHKLLHGLRLV